VGKIYYVMGKSATGKDTIYTRLFEESKKIKKIVLYTTRPPRSDEEDGSVYNFVTREKLEEFKRANKLIEMRTYKTMYGDWTYATVDDGKIRLESRNYLVIGTLESYKKVADYFGADKVVPIYITVDPGIRLQRALNRENMQEFPRYDEMCRRYLADEEDFSDEKLKEAGITKFYVNENLRACLDEIEKDMEPA
jgi:guanylate kinase